MRPGPNSVMRHDELRPAILDGVRRYQLFCKSFPLTDAAIPAKALRDRAVARWARQQDVAVDVRTSEDLGIAVANGIKPARIVVQGDTLWDNELQCTANLGVGRVIVGTIPQAEFLSACKGRVHGVLVRMTDPAAPGRDGRFGFPFGSDEADNAIGTVLGNTRLRLVGLHVRVGPDEHACISCPAAVGNMIAEMEHIRRRQGLVLTRIGLDCDIWLPDWGAELRELAGVIDDAVEDACTTMRFPRPGVLLSIGSATLRLVAA
jgi:diaminopimelate decarboxylase